MKFHSVVAAALAAWINTIAVGAPTIDGEFADWGERHIVARDPRGDGNATFDVTQLSATTQGTNLFIRFDTSSIGNLQSGAEGDPTLQLLVDLPRSRQLTIDFRAKSATLHGPAGDESMPWSRFDFVCLPTYAADQFELRMDLRPLDVQPCERVKIDFAGSDKLTRAVSVRLGNQPVIRTVRPVAKLSASDIRIVNLNTLHQGLADAGRSESIKRMLAAMAGDVVCFQEEWDEPAFRKAVGRVLPTAEKLNVHWARACGVATTWPLEPLPMEEAPGAAVAVELPSGERLVIFSIHLKCCGNAGSREDRRRVEQTEQLVQQIEKLRAGDFGDSLRNAGVVVVGDYNLVGSKQPLDVLATAGLVDWVIPGLRGETAYTWRRTREEDPFWPGRLDIVCYDHARLAQANGFVLNTSAMSADRLHRLQLRAHDSWASDHLMVVADFRLAE